VPRAILCDPWGDVAEAGSTSATDFPLKHAFQPHLAGSSVFDFTDGFVSTIENDPQPVTPTPLSLLGGRYLVEAIWSDPAAGQTGTGLGTSLGDASGYFAFFTPGSLELVVKMVDGRADNGAVWFFYGALSDVEYWLRVVDTQTGAVRLYHNPLGRLASVADTAAFPASASPAAPAAQAHTPILASADRSRIEASPAPMAAGSGCAQGTLCLLSGRFQVAVRWQVPALGTGAGIGVPLATAADESGTFWFFDPSDFELGVKILDGRAVNGHFWFFYGALSDVTYDVTVTDAATGQIKTYHNAAGTLASVADTAAF
jgi:hypothetical protein